MVPLPMKRLRFYEHEVPEVIEGLRLSLEKLLEEEMDQERAEIAFRILCRILNGYRGRPIYLEFSWKLLRDYLRIYVPTIEEMRKKTHGSTNN